MIIHNIILIAASIIAATLITVSNILARKAYFGQNEKLAKTAKLFGNIGMNLAFFALGMLIRVLFLT